VFVCFLYKKEFPDLKYSVSMLHIDCLFKHGYVFTKRSLLKIYLKIIYFGLFY